MVRAKSSCIYHTYSICRVYFDIYFNLWQLFIDFVRLVELGLLLDEHGFNGTVNIIGSFMCQECIQNKF